MPQKDRKLRKNYQFRYVYAHGKTISDGMLLLTYCTSKQKDPKIGISVSKKNGKATVRNRIKRLIREAVRAEYPSLKRGYNLVFAASAKYEFGAGTALAEVSTAVEGLLKRAGLLEQTTV